MTQRSFSWKTKFRSIIIVDDELFNNTYNLNLHILPTTPDLKEQTRYFERLKLLFSHIMGNTIIAYKFSELYNILKTTTSNRFIELPREPYDQIMAAVCFTKANAVLDGKIFVDKLELSSYQGDGITYSVTKDGLELNLLDVTDWFSKKYENFDPWWLRSDTATQDMEMSKGIFTGNFTWEPRQEVTKKTDRKDDHDHAKILKFDPKVLDGGKDKDK